jgi:hypothetical protein
MIHKGRARKQEKKRKEITATPPEKGKKNGRGLKTTPEPPLGGWRSLAATSPFQMGLTARNLYR